MNNSKWIRSLNEIINDYDIFIFDCDGVIYQENTPIKETVISINELQKLGKKTIFLSNNNSKSRSDLSNKLQKMNIENNDISLIYNSGFILSRYLSKYHPEITKVYLLGTEGLEKELSLCGIKCIGMHDGSKEFKLDEISKTPFLIDDDIQAVVCGFDDKFNYYKIMYASQIIYKTNQFFGTNTDKNIRVEGRLLPATYTFISALETCTNTKAKIVSKPDKFSYYLLSEDLNIGDRKNKVIMIGDNTETDIKFANNCGIDSILVFTGVTNMEEYSKGVMYGDNMGKPTYMMKNLIF